MVKIDLSKEPESRVVIGVNLWECRDCKLERAKSGAGGMMLVFKFKYRDVEITDRAQLEGNGWYYGRPKLLALGVKIDPEVDLDPLDFIGCKVWLATKAKDDINTKTGAKVRYTVLDESQLEHNGYQHAEKIPAGSNAPTAGNGPIGDDGLPF